MYAPVRFDFIPYPLWRRQVRSARLRPVYRAAVNLLTQSSQPLDGLMQPTARTPALLADYLTRWRLLPDGMQAADVRDALAAGEVNADPVKSLDTLPPTAQTTPPSAPLRLPAQWEPIETVLVSFPVLYPPLWATHAAMIKAICAVARVDVLIPQAAWAHPIRLILRETFGVNNWNNIHLIAAHVNDIWVRDYGPMVGLDEQGRQVAVDARFAPLSATYPQDADDSLPTRWAAARGMPVHALPLFTEGGNLWSDGAGTLIMSDELVERHAEMGLTLAQVESAMHQYFAFDTLILTPHLWREETGHVDLVCKLANAETLLVGAPTPFRNAERLRAAADQLRSVTNAAGSRYQVIPLPMPQVYLNWGIYPVWRSYTNALTVNGRVLVPTFNIREDETALRIYEQTMPAHAIVPIPCAAAANGGGAVHCLTKDIPAAQA
ncbi:MAG: agmatine deiminase family protein [bacterium]|nr:agmatine deiminase family protein [bacterium]